MQKKGEGTSHRNPKTGHNQKENLHMSQLKAMGIACEQLDENRIVIHPGKPHGCKIKTFEDHRVAMAFAIPGLVTDGIVIENPSCCRKTFENYFEILDTLCK